MTEPDRYGEEIRRALSAAAELVVPAGDGLDIIRKRAARRPPVLAWLLAYVSYLPRQLATRVRVVASELAVMAKGESDLLPRLRARLRPRAGRAHSAQAWLWPALAGAAVLVLVVAVTFAVPQLRATITDQANTGPSGGPGGGAGSSGQPYGSGHRSSGASGSSTTGFQSSSGLQPPMMTSGPMPRGPLYLMLPGPGGGTVPAPCVSSTPSYSPLGGGSSTGGTVATGSPGTGSGGTAGAPNDPQGSGNVRGGAPSCGPSGSPTPTTPPVTTPPVTTPPTTTPPVTTPPTTTPPVTTPPTTTPPSSTSAAPTDGSTASTPAQAPTDSGS